LGSASTPSEVLRRIEAGAIADGVGPALSMSPSPYGHQESRPSSMSNKAKCWNTLPMPRRCASAGDTLHLAPVPPHLAAIGLHDALDDPRQRTSADFFSQPPHGFHREPRAASHCRWRSPRGSVLLIPRSCNRSGTTGSWCELLVASSDRCRMRTAIKRSETTRHILPLTRACLHMIDVGIRPTARSRG